MEILDAIDTAYQGTVVAQTYEGNKVFDVLTILPPADRQDSETVGSLMLANMRQIGVERLLASCLNDACRHQGLVDVSNYPADTEVPWFRSSVKCAKCDGRGNKIGLRPNWKEQPPQPGLTGKVWR